MTYHEIAAQVLGVVTIIIAHDGIPYVGLVSQNVHDILFHAHVPTAVEAHVELPVLGVWQVVIDFCRDGGAGRKVIHPERYLTWDGEGVDGVVLQGYCVTVPVAVGANRQIVSLFVELVLVIQA